MLIKISNKSDLITPCANNIATWVCTFNNKTNKIFNGKIISISKLNYDSNNKHISVMVYGNGDIENGLGMKSIIGKGARHFFWNLPTRPIPTHLQLHHF